MLTIGYIGNGKSTNRYHLPRVLLRENITVKTIFDLDIEHPSWDIIPTIHYTSNLDELLNDPEIQAIVITTPHPFHYDYCKMVLDHGKHVLCEKPFMNSYDEAKKIFAYAKKKGLHIQCFQNRRYDSDFLTVQSVIESGLLGEIYEIEMHFDYYRPEVPMNIHHYYPSDSYLYGHGCHTLDQVISYFGEPDKVHYDVRQILGTGRMNDYFDLDLYYNNLKISVKSSYFRIKQRPSFVVYGTKGMFEKVTPDRQEEHLKQFYMPTNPDFGVDTPKHYGTITYQDIDGTIQSKQVPSKVGDYGIVYDDFYNVIIHGNEPVITSKQTLLQMSILEKGASMCK